jgi:hypothetical protein
MVSEKRQARAHVVLTMSVLAVLAAGIAVAIHRGGSSDDESASAQPTATVTSTPSSAKAAPADRDLFTPPSTFVWVPDDVAGTGAVDASKAAQLDGTGTLSVAGLQQLGFIRGASRQWHAEPVDLVDVVYTFSQPGQATVYVASLVAARRGDPGFVVVTPAGAPVGATTFTNTASGGNSAAMVFATGTHAVVIGLVASGTFPDTTQLATLASQQAAFSAAS